MSWASRSAYNARQAEKREIQRLGAELRLKEVLARAQAAQSAPAQPKLKTERELDATLGTLKRVSQWVELEPNPEDRALAQAGTKVVRVSRCRVFCRSEERFYYQWHIEFGRAEA